MDFLDEFPTMDRQELRDLKKAIDLGFRNFSRAYGDALEAFFEPLLYFMVWLEKLLIVSPWPIIILIMAWRPQLARRIRHSGFILRDRLLRHVGRYDGNAGHYLRSNTCMYSYGYSTRNLDGPF